MPFGIAQIGKSFRNEITPGNFIFRTREFEQMELEFFCAPDEDLKWFEYWKDFCKNWLLELGMTKENFRMRDHSPEELSTTAKPPPISSTNSLRLGWSWGNSRPTDMT